MELTGAITKGSAAQYLDKLQVCNQEDQKVMYRCKYR